jgi:hypothetical protein
MPRQRRGQGRSDRTALTWTLRNCTGCILRKIEPGAQCQGETIMLQRPAFKLPSSCWAVSGLFKFALRTVACAYPRSGVQAPVPMAVGATGRSAGRPGRLLCSRLGARGAAARGTASHRDQLALTVQVPVLPSRGFQARPRPPADPEIKVGTAPPH